MTGIVCFISLLLLYTAAFFLYPAHNKEDDEGKLLIAVFSPLIGVAILAIKQCDQFVCSSTGSSAILDIRMYFCRTALMFRVLQADLGRWQSIATFVIIYDS